MGIQGGFRNLGFMPFAGRRTLGDLQAQSETARISKFGGHIAKLAKTDLKQKQCQWIEGSPSRKQYRTLGADYFKCLDSVSPGSSYCAHHRTICYVPLTKDEE